MTVLKPEISFTRFKIIFIPNTRAELMPQFEKIPKPKNELNTHKVLLLVRPKP